MKKFYLKYLSQNTPFWVLTIVALSLLVAAFIVPPTAVIDKSVLAAVGEIIGLGAMWSVVYAINNGTSATIKHNGTEVIIDGDGESTED